MALLVKMCRQDSDKYWAGSGRGEVIQNKRHPTGEERQWLWACRGRALSATSKDGLAMVTALRRTDEQLLLLIQFDTAGW